MSGIFRSFSNQNSYFICELMISLTFHQGVLVNELMAIVSHNCIEQIETLFRQVDVRFGVANRVDFRDQVKPKNSVRIIKFKKVLTRDGQTYEALITFETPIASFSSYETSKLPLIFPACFPEAKVTFHYNEIIIYLFIIFHFNAIFSFLF